MSRFEGGYIKVYRSCVNGDIGMSGSQLAVWVTLLAWATRFESVVRFKGERRTIPPGCILTGVREISKHLKLSKDVTLRALRALQDRDSIRRESAPHGTLITICNWGAYSGSEESAATPARHQRDTSETAARHWPTLNGELENKEIQIPASRKKKSGIENWDLLPLVESSYARYPRKRGRADGLRRLEQMLKTEEDARLFDQAVTNYVAEIVRDKTEPRHIKHFSSFVGTLENPVWRDYLEADSTGWGSSAAKPQKLKTLEDLRNERQAGDP